MGGQQQILKYKKTGKVIPLGSGFYRTPSASEFEARVLVVAQYYPNAVISGLAALKLHGLADSVPAEVEADIQRTTNMKNNLIRFRRVSQSRMIGIGEVKLHGQTVNVYNTERAWPSSNGSNSTKGKPSSAGALTSRGMKSNPAVKTLRQSLRTGFDRGNGYPAIEKGILSATGRVGGGRHPAGSRH